MDAISVSDVLGGIFGVVVGDAQGVPVEFTSRIERERDPVKSMREYGTYSQPRGTWSDDSSLTLCSLVSLCAGYSPDAIIDQCVRWYSSGEWTPHGEVFDIGIATRLAFQRRLKHVPSLSCGGRQEGDNGNGSLMRILPLVFFTYKMPLLDRFRIVHEVSSLTHGHIRSIFACFLYIEFIQMLLSNKGTDKRTVYRLWQANMQAFHEEHPEIVPNSEFILFKRLINNNIADYPLETIMSTGYVLHSIEASFWSFLTTQSYEECVLSAVNMGNDTDTTAAIAGGIAGIYYGYSLIPKDWLKVIVKHDEIEQLCIRYHAANHQ